MGKYEVVNVLVNNLDPLCIAISAPAIKVKLKANDCLLLSLTITYTQVLLAGIEFYNCMETESGLEIM